MLDVPGFQQTVSLCGWVEVYNWCFGQVNWMASLKHMLCNSRGCNVSILESPMVFLQVYVEWPPGLSNVGARTFSTWDAIDHSLLLSHCDWVFGVNQHLLRVLRERKVTRMGKWAEDSSNRLRQTVDVREGQIGPYLFQFTWFPCVDWNKYLSLVWHALISIYFIPALLASYAHLSLTWLSLFIHPHL